jgi:hypothetical protein
MYDWSTHVPGNHEIETASGRYVDLLNPDPRTIIMTDVATGLSNTCRYNGQVEFYSVAQHAWTCAARARSLFPDRPDLWLLALHHDDAEAYLGDVTRPLKSLLQPTYGDLSDRMDKAIQEALNLPLGDPLDVPEIKAIDNWALMLEARNLLRSKGRLWGVQAHNWGLDEEDESDSGLWIAPQSPASARDMFLAAHNYITRQF